MKESFKVKGKVWKHPGKGGWYFVAVKNPMAEKVRTAKNKTKVGWGYIRIRATIRTSSWETTLFPNKQKEYLLAVNERVRKKEKIDHGSIVNVSIVLI